MIQHWSEREREKHLSRLLSIHRSECFVWNLWWKCGLVEPPHWFVERAWKGAEALMKVAGVCRSRIETSLRRGLWVNCDYCREDFQPINTRQEEELLIARCPHCRQWVEI